MYYIANDVIFVKGATKGAIYDFATKNVYWINSKSCALIDRLISNDETLSSLTDDEKEYIELLSSKKLYDISKKPVKYLPPPIIPPVLEMAWLEITQACNCKCIHCYQGNEHPQVSNVLTLDDWKRVIQELGDLNVSRVVVIGGEPCVHKHIYDILLELYHQGINTTLFTNATTINPRLMELLVQCADRISVKVSLYADNSRDHDAITQCPGSFEKLVKNVRQLTQLGVSVDIAVVAMRENQDKLSHIRDFVHSLGAHYSKFDVIRNVFGGTQNQHTPTDPEIINSCSFCRPNFKASKRRFEENYQINSCWYGKIAITETGEVLPCVFERNIVYGNVQSSSVAEILQLETLRKHWFMSFDQVELCKDCEFRFSCKDCRPLGISVEGKITTKNPRCKYNPYTGEWS